MSIKQTKRTFYETKELLKDIMYIRKDYHLADDMGVNRHTFRNAVARNAIPYKELLEFCRVKKIDILSLLYKTQKATHG